MPQSGDAALHGRHFCGANPSPPIRTAKPHLIVLRLEEKLPAGDGVLLAAAVTVPAEGGACRHIPEALSATGLEHEGLCQLKVVPAHTPCEVWQGGLRHSTGCAEL